MIRSFSKIYTGKLLGLVMIFCLPAATATAEDVRSMSVAVSADKSEVRQGDLVTYYVAVRNTGIRDLRNVSILDSFPRGTQMVSCSVKNYLKGKHLEVPITHLAAGEEYSFELVMKLQRKGRVEKLIRATWADSVMGKDVAWVDVKSSNVLDINVTAFSPNGDGINDLFQIPGLLNYPNNELTVFNRFSDKVYQKKSYANDWDGFNVPDDSYYYLLTVTLENGTVQKYNGLLTIKR
ncbi:MAG: gliding motility-associated C-terminal domain-containing protein [Prevotellaceae bacterium]|jgi:gliding motility-associated-like protein/uncharacterized repeat protein (TIGR01451 family)|nr:gliding motility-associated C-terminal domain-containing protein [Prevotellaceae bacterium]